MKYIGLLFISFIFSACAYCQSPPDTCGEGDPIEVHYFALVVPILILENPIGDGCGSESGVVQTTLENYGAQQSRKEAANRIQTKQQSHSGTSSN